MKNLLNSVATTESTYRNLGLKLDYTTADLASKGAHIDNKSYDRLETLISALISFSWEPMQYSQTLDAIMDTIDCDEATMDTLEELNDTLYDLAHEEEGKEIFDEACDIEVDQEEYNAWLTS